LLTYKKEGGRVTEGRIAVQGTLSGAAFETKTETDQVESK